MSGVELSTSLSKFDLCDHFWMLTIVSITSIIFVFMLPVGTH